MRFWPPRTRDLNALTLGDMGSILRLSSLCELVRPYPWDMVGPYPMYRSHEETYVRDKVRPYPSGVGDTLDESNPQGYEARSDTRAR